MPQSELAGLVVALLGGAGVGLEGQCDGNADGLRARFAGIRTFTLLSALGGLSGDLWRSGMTLPAGVLLAGAVLIVVAGYVVASRTDIDGTTEVAALVVLAAGIFAGIGSIRLASGIFALLTLILVEKSRLHALVKRIDDVGLRSGVQFGVMALVILPLLPEGPFGPVGGIRPRELWALVLFFSALSFAGFVARRVAGPGRGYLVTGLLGGLVSSTNTTLMFARASRHHRSMERALAFGAVAANAMLFPRVVVPALVLYLAPPAAVAVALMLWYRTSGSEERELTPRNPLQLAQALQMAVMFQAVLVLVYLARSTWGTSGVLSAAAVLGLTDVDALTISMARDIAPALSAQTAAAGIAIGIGANTLVKLGIALFFGSRQFKLIVGGALTLTLAALSAVLVWRVL